MKLIGQNHTIAEAAQIMHVSYRTAKTHAERARLKVGVSRTRDLPRVLRELGMLD